MGIPRGGPTQAAPVPRCIHIAAAAPVQAWPEWSEEAGARRGLLRWVPFGSPASTIVFWLVECNNILPMETLILIYLPAEFLGRTLVVIL